MKLFVLLGLTRWEGDDVLGVYSSLETAREAAEVYRNSEEHCNYDDYAVEVRELDALPEDYWRNDALRLDLETE